MNIEQREKLAIANAWAHNPAGFETMCFETIEEIAEEEDIALNIAAGIFAKRLPLYAEILNTIHFLPKEPHP